MNQNQEKKARLRLGFQLTGSEVTAFLLTLSAEGPGELRFWVGERRNWVTPQLFTSKIPKGQVPEALEAKRSPGPGRAWL